MPVARPTVKNPAASCGASSIPKEEHNCSRLLTPKLASGNAQTLGFNMIWSVFVVKRTKWVGTLRFEASKERKGK